MKRTLFKFDLHGSFTISINHHDPPSSSKICRILFKQLHKIYHCRDGSKCDWSPNRRFIFFPFVVRCQQPYKLLADISDQICITVIPRFYFRTPTWIPDLFVTESRMVILYQGYSGNSHDTDRIKSMFK